MSHRTCAECGARVEADQTQCELCGWDTTQAEHAIDTANSAKVTLGPFCNSCGWANPSGARFCSQCGAQLQEVAKPQAPTVQARPKRKANVAPGTTRQVVIIFGLATMMIITLFMITAISKQTQRPDPATALPEVSASAGQPAPMSSELADRVAELDEAIAQDSSAIALALEREKVFVLSQGGRTDLAAEAQQTIARRTGDQEDWRIAGNLYYDWMMGAEDPAERGRVASLAVTAYQAVLARDPDNHDVRTDMATAYLNTGNPMLGVTAIKRVLEAAPDHLNANFNYGLMLARINRNEEALVQLGRVLELSPDTSSNHHQRARALMASIRAQAGF